MYDYPPTPTSRMTYSAWRDYLARGGDGWRAPWDDDDGEYNRLLTRSESGEEDDDDLDDDDLDDDCDQCGEPFDLCDCDSVSDDNYDDDDDLYNWDDDDDELHPSYYGDELAEYAGDSRE
jgi:hypothetical protein